MNANIQHAKMPKTQSKSEVLLELIKVIDKFEIEELIFVYSEEKLEVEEKEDTKNVIGFTIDSDEDEDEDED